MNAPTIPGSDSTTPEVPGSIPLQKWLMATGIASRNEIRLKISLGLVSVDGEAITRFAHPVLPEQVICVDGEPVRDKAPRTLLLMNKPVKHITGLEDPEGRATLGQYLPEGIPRLFPVGRLDYNTEGALLWTNDGYLARRILHPDYHLEKTYRIKIRGILEEDDPGLERMRKGIKLSNFTTRPARVEIVVYRSRATWIEVVITEGKFRQLRRMCRACHYQIVKLHRIAIGPLQLGEITPRCVRFLDPEEILALDAAVGL